MVSTSLHASLHAVAASCWHAYEPCTCAHKQTVDADLRASHAPGLVS